MVIPPDWDLWLAQQGGGAAFCQTSAWARIHEAVNSARSCVVAVDRNGARVAAALVSIRPPEKSDLVRRLGLRIAGVVGGTLECFEGPVLTRTASPEDASELLALIHQFGVHQGVSDIRFAGPPPLVTPILTVAMRKALGDFGYVETPWLTRVLDLTKDEQALHAEFRQAARKGIRKSVEAGLKVTFARTWDEYRDLFCAAYYEESGLDAEVARRCEAFWHADEERSYRFFVVHDDAGHVHATLGTYRYQGMATEIMSRRTSAGVAANLPAQDLLHWHVIRHHRNEGDTFFNLAGFNPAPNSPKEEGIRRFKEKWGGQEYSVPAFTWTRKSPMIAVARWLKQRVHTA